MATDELGDAEEAEDEAEVEDGAEVEDEDFAVAGALDDEVDAVLSPHPVKTSAPRTMGSR